jgi:hypothetical protein
MGKDMSRPKNVGIAQSRAHNSRIIREMFALREIHVPRIRAPVGQSNISIDDVLSIRVAVTCTHALA